MAIGKFEVLGPLGRGAGSTVLKVRRDSDGKVYALKVVKMLSADDRIYVDQVQHEFDVASGLQHENLCRIYEIELERTLLRSVKGAKLLMEFVDGLPLSACSKLPLIKLVFIFARTAAGLAHMHAQGLYHADVKPENIMVTPKADAKVVDFGVVWRRGENKNRVQGTMDYLAPEQAKKKVVNAKTDVFNLGATMYRTLAGSAVASALIEPGASKLQRIDDLVRPIADLNPDVPAELDAFIRSCVRYRPEHRPASMKDVFRELREHAKALAGKGKGHSADEE